MQILKILFFTLFVFAPFGEIFRFDLGNNVYFKPLDGLSLLLGLWVTVLYLRHKSWRASLKWYYFFFPLIGAISLVVNSVWLQPNELLVSGLYLLRWVGYFSIFLAVMQLDNQFKKMLQKLMIVDGVIVLVIGFFQFFLYPSLRNLFYLGWDEHLYRLFSSFLDPNFAGAFLVLYFIFLLDLLFQNLQHRHSGKPEAHPESFRDPGQARMTLIKIGHFALILFTLIAIFLTYSRGAFLMLFVSGITFFLLLQKKKFIFLLVGAFVVFVLIISPFFYIENLNLFRVHSSLARLETAQRALEIVPHNPLIGVGFDSYRYAQVHYHVHTAQTKFPAHSDSGVDMSLLFVLATTGIAGLIAYCYLWLRLLAYARERKREGVVVLASSIGLFVNALFINSLFYPTIMLWMWLIFGLLPKKKED